MRRLVASALAMLLLVCVPIARTTTLSGAISNPDGSGFNGQLIIRLQRNGVRNTCVNPSIVVPTTPVVLPVANGLIQNPTNFVLWSQDLENSPWSLGGSNPPSITADNQVAPDGTTTADTVAFPSITTGQATQITQNTSSITFGQPYTFSQWLKAATTVSVIAFLQNNLGIGGQTTWNVTTSWQRFSITATLASGGGGTAVLIGIGEAGVNPAVTVFAWGAQLEFGSATSSYKATTKSYTAQTDIVPNDCFSAFTTYSAELHDASHATVSNSQWWVTQPDGAAQATENKYLWPAGLVPSPVSNPAILALLSYGGGYASSTVQTGNVVGSSSANIAVTWPASSFQTAAYAVACTVVDNTAPLAPQIYAASIVSQTAQAVTVSVTNQNASPRGGTLTCRGHA